MSKSRNGKIVVWNTQTDAPPHLEFTMKNQGILNCSCIIDIRYFIVFAIGLNPFSSGNLLNARFKQSRWQNPCMWDIPWNNTLLLSRDGTAFAYTQTSSLNKTGPAMSIHEGGSRFALCWWGRCHLEVRCFLALFKMRLCLEKALGMIPRLRYLLLHRNFWIYLVAKWSHNELFFFLRYIAFIDHC